MSGENQLKNSAFLNYFLVPGAFAGMILIFVLQPVTGIIAQNRRMHRQREVLSKIESLVTNSHVSISNDTLRIYSEGTNYDFSLEYKGMKW